VALKTRVIDLNVEQQLPRIRRLCTCCVLRRCPLEPSACQK